MPRDRHRRGASWPLWGATALPFPLRGHGRAGSRPDAPDHAAGRTRSWQQPSQASQQAAAQNSDQQQATQLTATQKAEQCAKARQRYDTYMNSQRLYQKEADGQRRYLSDEELTAARASAKASMDVMCK